MCLFDYIFLNTTYRPGYHHNGFMATDAIEHIQVHQLQENIEARTTYMNQRCMFSVVLLHASGLNTKFTVKHLCHILFFSKVTGLKPATLLKKRLWHRSYHVNFVKFAKKSFFIEHLW